MWNCGRSRRMSVVCKDTNSYQIYKCTLTLKGDHHYQYVGVNVTKMKSVSVSFLLYRIILPFSTRMTGPFKSLGLQCLWGYVSILLVFNVSLRSHLFQISSASLLTSVTVTRHPSRGTIENSESYKQLIWEHFHAVVSNWKIEGNILVRTAGMG